MHIKKPKQPIIRNRNILAIVPAGIVTFPKKEILANS
jgi:hypothetical protein